MKKQEDLSSNNIADNQTLKNLSGDLHKAHFVMGKLACVSSRISPGI